MWDKQGWHDIRFIFISTDFNYRAEKYGEIDPQAGFSNSYLKSIFLIFNEESYKNHTKSVDSLSIHHANSRFLTIHQTD